MSTITLTFHSHHPNAKLPTQAKDEDAGFDQYAVEDFQLKPNRTALIKTGIAIANYEALNHFYLKVEGRSGMALKGILPLGGIVDKSYRSDIGVILLNSTSDTYEIKAGDRVAQLIVYELPKVIMKLDNSCEILESERSKNGYGSSGR
jgi:dUTP pyrophosphatase